MEPPAESPGPGREAILAGARRVLTDGRPRKAKEIAAALAAQGLPGVEKALVNSVLSREGRGLVHYDSATWSYTLATGAGADAPAADNGDAPGPPGDTSATLEPGEPAAAVPQSAVLSLARSLLRDGQPRTAREITAALVQHGLAGADKSLVNSVLAREGHDEFAYDRATFMYRRARDPGGDARPGEAP